MGGGGPKQGWGVVDSFLNPHKSIWVVHRTERPLYISDEELILF